MPAPVNIADLSVRISVDGVDPAQRALSTVEHAGGSAAKSIGMFGNAVGPATGNLRSFIAALDRVASSALGVERPIGTLFGHLAPFALGGEVTAGVLLGITALAEAWKLFGHNAEAAAKQAVQAKEKLDQLQDRGDTAGLTARAQELFAGHASKNFTDGLQYLRGQIATETANLEEISKTKDVFAFNAARTHLADLQRQAAPLEAEFADVRARLMGAGPSLARDTSAIVTSAASPGELARQAKQAAELAAREREAAVKGQHAPEIGVARDSIKQALDALNAQIKIAPPHAIKVPLELTPELVRLQDFKDAVDAQFSSFMPNLVGGLADSWSALFRDGFGSAKDVLLQALGGIFEQMGKSLLMYGAAMVGLLPALENPFTSGPAALVAGAALVALGGLLSHAAKGHASSGSFSSGSYGGAYSSGGASIVDRGYIGMPGTITAAGMQAIRGIPGSYGTSPTMPSASGFVVLQPVIIGPNDPAAQRGLVDTLRAAQARGLRI